MHTIYPPSSTVTYLCNYHWWGIRVLTTEGLFSVSKNEKTRLQLFCCASGCTLIFVLGPYPRGVPLSTLNGSSICLTMLACFSGCTIGRSSGFPLLSASLPTRHLIRTVALSCWHCPSSIYKRNRVTAAGPRLTFTAFPKPISHSYTTTYYYSFLWLSRFSCMVVEKLS